MTGREGAADLAVTEAIHVQQRGCFRLAQTVSLDEGDLGYDVADRPSPALQCGCRKQPLYADLDPKRVSATHSPP